MMSCPEYSSAIYKINTSKSTATKICNSEYYCNSILPKEMSIDELAKLIVKMQKVCFKDINNKNTNKKRLVELLSSTHEKTIIVAVSLGYLDTPKNMFDFVDGGIATVQKANYEMIKYQQPWINEVCRAKYREVNSKSPVSIVMDLIEKYIQNYLMKTSKTIDGMYLYIEKKPTDGKPDFLLKYYKKYGFVRMDYEDDDYFYMCKKL